MLNYYSGKVLFAQNKKARHAAKHDGLELVNSELSCQHS